LRKAAIGLAILLVLVIAGLALAPQLVDLGSLKAPLSAQLTARIGRTVELGGPIGLSLLPSPTITARDVRIANPPGATVPEMVKLRAIEVKLALWPLLLRRIEMRSATLIEPDIDLERLASGEASWQVPPAATSGGAPGGEANNGSRALAVSIDHLAIQNGTVTYRGPGTIERFEHINATVTFDSLLGPYHAVGELVARGAALGFDVQSGSFGAPDVPLQVTVTTRPAARLDLEATLTGAPGDRRIAGKLKIAADDLQAVAATLLRTPMPAAAAQHFALAGDLVGSAHGVAIDHMAADLGQVHGEGNFHYNPEGSPAIALVFSINSLDLDHATAAVKSARAGAAAASTPRPHFPGGLVLPRGIDASIELGIEAVLWRNGLIREARLKAALTDGRLTVTRLAALLPGGSDVVVSGSATAAPEGPRALGVVEANADDLRSLLAWAGFAADDVPADRLRKAALSGRFTLAGERLDLTGLDVTLDATRLNCAATVILRERPGFGIRLSADRFNLDAYLPRGPAPPRVGAATTASPPSKPGGEGGLSDVLAGIDANLDAHIDALTWRGQPFNDVHLSATLQNTEATIRELSIGDVGGASGKLSGVIEGLSGGVPKGQLAFDMRGPEFERVLRLVSPALVAGRTFGAFSLGGGAQSNSDGYSVDSDLEILNGHAHVSGTIAPDSDKFDLTIDADHPNFAGLLRVFNPTYRLAGGDVGAVKLGGRIVGGAGHFDVNDLSLAIGNSTLDGTLGITLGGARPALAADIKLGDWSIDRFLTARQAASFERGARHAGLLAGVLLAEAEGPPARAAPASTWSRTPLDLGLLRLADIDLSLSGDSVAYAAWRIDRPKLSAKLNDGALEIKAFNGTLFGGTVDLTGDLGSSPSPVMHAKLALGNAELRTALTDIAGIGSIDGRFDVKATLAASAGSPADIVSHLQGDASLAARDGSISGVNLKAMNERLSALGRPVDLVGLMRSAGGGRTSFATLDGTFHVQDGVAQSDDIHLAADGGEGRATATFDLPRWTMKSRAEFHLTGVANAPPLVLHLDGPIDDPRKVFDVNALEQFVAQRLLNTVNPQAQPPARAPAPQ